MGQAPLRIPRDLARRVAELLGVPRARVVRVQGGSGAHAAALIAAGDHRLVVHARGSGAAASVLAGIDAIQKSAAAFTRTRAIPVLAVPFMGEVGQLLCDERHVQWFDFSGNAHIVAPGLRIHVEGKPNRFKRPGRPSTAFAPKSSRIARCLLLHPKRGATQRELAGVTGLGEGYVSRIVRRLVDDGLLARSEEGLIRAADPARLLDAWWDEYDFAKHRILRGHVPARSQEELLASVTNALKVAGVQHAATGLAAAWMLTHHATYRVATFFIASPMDDATLEKLGFREDDQGANVWLVQPNDEGVFHGAAPQDGVPCVSVVQAYLDLKGHPERAKEAADELRRQRMPWARHV